MLKVSALFLCVISCLVFHCDDSQGDSATERQTSSSNYSSDNARLAESISDSHNADEQLISPDYKADPDKVPVPTTEQLLVTEATDSVDHDDSKEEKSLETTHVTSVYPTPRSSFPPESPHRAANRDEVGASSLPPDGVPTTSEGKAEVSSTEQKGDTAEDRPQEAEKEGNESTPPTTTTPRTTTTPPTTTTTHTTTDQIDIPPMTPDLHPQDTPKLPPVDTPDQPPVVISDQPHTDTPDLPNTDTPDEPPVDTPDQPPLIPPVDTSKQPPQVTPDKPPMASGKKSESQKEEKVGATKATGTGEDRGEAVDLPIKGEQGARDKEDVKVEEGGQGVVEGAGRQEREGKETDPGVQNVEDMPSFEEWKRQMLVKQKAELVEKRQLEGQISAPGGATQNKPKNRVNYAKASCGAKVIAANPEATNPAFILTENRDQYMINPCNVKKWFVVELCEPIQIENLELGNLELFSSQPEQFVVSISGRYPTKEWKVLGTLHAREKRTVQSFSVSDQLFIKYLRLEMKSHYGNEHYCPLTVLRVFGLTVLDDDIDEFAYGPGEGSSPDESAPSSKEEKPSNLFSSAADTVLSLVKTVLSPSEEQQNSSDDRQLDGVVKLDVVAKNASNITEKNKLNATAPCTAHHSSSATKFHSRTAGGAAFYWCERCKSQDKENVCYFDICAYFNVSNVSWPVSCAQDIEQLSQKKNTALSGTQDGLTVEKNVSHEASISDNDNTPKGEAKELNAAVNEREEETKSDDAISEEAPAATSSESKVTQHSDRMSKSSLDVIVIMPSSSEVTHSDTTSTAKAVDTVSVIIAPPSTASVSGDNLIDALNATVDVSMGTLDSSVGVVTPMDVTVTPTVMLGDDLVTKEVDISSSHDSNPSESETVTQDMQPTPVLSAAVTTPTLTLQSETHAEDKTRGQNMPARQDKPVMQDSPVTPDPTSNDTAKGKTISPDKDTENNQTVPTPPDTPSNSSDSAEKNIYAEMPLDSEREGAPIPPTEAEGEEVPVNRLAKKEMTYMRLKNRIKTLEENLNLSSSYLEQLSKRYKLYMDNMYHYLNQTINKLANTTESAEARDLKQQEDIARLQKHVNKLTVTVNSLLSGNDQLHKQLIERHLFLMLLEAIVFVCVILWFISRQRIATQANTHSTPVLVSPSSRGTPSHPKHRRHKSVDLTPSRQKLRLAPGSQDDLLLHKSSECDSALTIISQDIPLFITSNSASKSSQEQLRLAPPHNKKKKKKKKGVACQKQLWHKDACQSISHTSVSHQLMHDSESDSLSAQSTSSGSTSKCPPQSTNWSSRTSSSALLSAHSMPDTSSSNCLVTTEPRRPLDHVANIGACQICTEPMDDTRNNHSDRFFSLLNNLKTKWNSHTPTTGGNDIYSSIVHDSQLSNNKSIQLCKQNGQF